MADEAFTGLWLNEQVKCNRNRDRFDADFLFQFTQDEKAKMDANYTHLRNRIAPSKPGRRPIGFLTREDKNTPKASRLTPGMVHMLAAAGDEKDSVRVFYVAATKATRRLVLGVNEYQEFAAGLIKSPASEWRVK
jgi:hypothetical protein